ncbi:MAG: Flp pilus assembly protein CpaB [Chloroflexi bacterium]|nr:MAG: Flp pilus assembly protein CpaB [Chloroflexota bacterium]
MASIGQARPATTVRTPLFILGVALALVAFLAMFAFGVVFTARSQNSGQLRVVVAARDIQPREPITPDMLSLATLPATAAPPKAFVRATDLTGYSAVVEIYKGQTLTPNIVSSSPDQLAGPSASTFLPIPEGYIAITVPTGEQQGVGGYVATGDYINVIATVNTALYSNATPRTVTRTVFTSLYVIRVGPASALPKQGLPQGVSSSLTVVMSLCDAQYLDWLIANASLKYVLLSYHNYAKDTAAPDAGCPPTAAPGVIGPSLVDKRWAFTSG